VASPVLAALRLGGRRPQRAATGAARGPASRKSAKSYRKQESFPAWCQKTLVDHEVIRRARPAGAKLGGLRGIRYAR
jgi:hypothetical protein